VNVKLILRHVPWEGKIAGLGRKKGYVKTRDSAKAEAQKWTWEKTSHPKKPSFGEK